MDNSLYDDNCPYWWQPEHIAYYSNSESTYQEEQEYEYISNCRGYETDIGEATFNEREMAHSHNQDWSEENWVPMQWDQGKIQQYGDEGEDPPYRESTSSQWSHTQLTSPQPQFKHHQPCPENLQHAAWQSATMVAIQEDHLNPPEWLLFTPNDTVFA